MDNKKPFKENEKKKKLETMIRYPLDIGMEFVIQRCVILMIKKKVEKDKKREE